MSAAPLAPPLHPLTRAGGRRPRRLARTPVAALVVALLPALAPTVLPSPAAALPTPTCAEAGIEVTSLGGPNFYIDNGASPDFTSGYTGYRVTNATGSGLPDTWVRLSQFTGGSLALAPGQPAAQRVGSLDDGDLGALFWYLDATTGLSSTPQRHTITVYRHDPQLPTSQPLCTTVDGFASVAGTIAANANKVTGIDVIGGTPALGAVFDVHVTGQTGTIGSGIANDPSSFWMTPAVAADWPAGSFRLVGTRLDMPASGSDPAVHEVDTLRVANLPSASRDYTATYTFQAVGFTPGPTTVMPVQEIASGTQVKHTGAYPATLPAIAAPVNDLSLALAHDPSRLPAGGGSVTYTATLAGTPGAVLDSFRLTVPPRATLETASATWAATSLPDPVRLGDELVFPGPFTAPPGGGKLVFTVAHDGTGGDQVTTLVGALGEARIGATAAVDGSNPATATIDVDSSPVAGPVTTTVAPDTETVIDVSEAVSDPDGDPVTVSSASGAEHGSAWVDEGGLKYRSDLGFTGDDSFTYVVADGRGGTASATVTVHVVAGSPPPTPPVPAGQSLHFRQPDDLVVGSGTDLEATATSGLAVTYTSLTPAVCTIDDARVTAVTEGTCSVEATQEGNATYAAATPVTRTFAALAVPAGVQEAQTIDFALPASRVLAGPSPLVLEAGSDSGLPVGLAVVEGGCTLTDAGLVSLTSGECTVEATQPGAHDHAAATPVRRAVTFVLPSDDAVTMTRAARRGATVTVSPLANDPEGLRLVGVSAPSHGAATRSAGRALRYAPATGFRGVDTFTYEVEDALGRRATATVTVTVPNAVPSVADDRLRQLAGSEARLRLRTDDLNGDDLTVRATSHDPGVRPAVDGGDLVVHARRAVSGWVTVDLRVADGAGGVATATVRDLVTPGPVAAAERRLTDDGTVVSWTEAPTDGARYAVEVEGRVLCRTSSTSCTLDRVLGPEIPVRVQVLGADDTSSSYQPAHPVGHYQFLVTTVYFDSGRWTLDEGQRDRVVRAALVSDRRGFGVAQLRGYTDTDGGAAYNLRLSRRRTDTVARLLEATRGLRSSQEWFGYDDPVADNDTPQGKARNRRVEVWIGY